MDHGSRRCVLMQEQMQVQTIMRLGAVDFSAGGIPSRPRPRRAASLEGTTPKRPAATSHANEPFSQEGAAFNLATDADLLDLILSDRGSSRAAMVELHTTYPHFVQAVDLQLCHTATFTGPVGAPEIERDASMQRR